MQKVLVPLDGSATAEEIIPGLRPLLGGEPADVILFRAVHFPVGDLHVPLDVRGLEAETKRYLERTAQRLTREGIAARALTAIGDPARAITNAAAAEGVSLLAMTTHGHTGLARVVLGSVAEEVLRAADVPVWLARAGTTFRPIRTLLVPLDGSELSASVLPAATEAARRLDASILLLHVFPRRPERSELDRPALPLQEPQQVLARQGVRVASEFYEGDPADRILLAIRDQRADAVAMTTHGRTGLSRLVFGSVTESVVRRSPVPSLILRAGARVAAASKSGSHA
jgi:nucleotide-binding universal stress UspA family protein